MDRFQHRLVGIALEIVGDRGFVLGGGHAVQMHGMGARPSEDIDLFSSRRGSPEQVADEVIAGYARQGLRVEVARRTPDLVQMTVTDSDDHACKVDLGVFWRAHAPVVLEIGPVLHPDDAVAGKMDALFNRWAPRDFLDIDAILVSGRYGHDRLLAVVAEHNPGFDTALFAESLSYLHRIPDRDFTAYGVPSAQIEAMRDRFAAWERELSP
ncbi:nucleotidyl transferase AbiEii/AbiGii toxin family protein [Actinomadura sp. BRA 177]|uniref:nucleotidyl transferase AbiEii/AbiGii toxin family protein n=1 Tax=Actinomadura sp. BRA 177 TaxID=2745202 RepID=UPI00159601CA|nr:nucleotidyl transferase AbiEii/AbiGii toxin family protein [Actinomadura sp. BRA 177]NVI86122.1 nucleotidyl transferase AbiEii/AbiGii toxin family protein [Actinomadura sp. BRA 177]